MCEPAPGVICFLLGNTRYNKHKSTSHDLSALGEAKQAHGRIVE